MGYRPYIYIKEKGESSAIELYKFYGYVKLDYLQSIKWLLDHKKIKDPHIFDYAGFGPSIEFTDAEFREWFDLYRAEATSNYIIVPRAAALKDVAIPQGDDISESIFDEHPGLKEIYLDTRSKVVFWE